MKLLLLSAAFLLVAISAQADIVTDSITAAEEAYAAGDLGAASTALKTAMHDIGRQQSAVLAAVLPPAPDGFTREDSADFMAGMAMFGGGSGAEAAYVQGDTRFTVSIMADNELVGGMLGMFSDPGMMAMMGSVEAVGDVNILTADDGSIMSIIGGRYMISAQGATADVMLPVVRSIDFAKLTEMAGQ